MADNPKAAKERNFGEAYPMVAMKILQPGELMAFMKLSERSYYRLKEACAAKGLIKDAPGRTTVSTAEIAERKNQLQDLYSCDLLTINEFQKALYIDIALVRHTFELNEDEYKALTGWLSIISQHRHTVIDETFMDCNRQAYLVMLEHLERITAHHLEQCFVFGEAADDGSTTKE